MGTPDPKRVSVPRVESANLPMRMSQANSVRQWGMCLDGFGAGNQNAVNFLPANLDVATLLAKHRRAHRANAASKELLDIVLESKWRNCLDRGPRR